MAVHTVLDHDEYDLLDGKSKFAKLPPDDSVIHPERPIKIIHHIIVNTIRIHRNHVEKHFTNIRYGSKIIAVIIIDDANLRVGNRLFALSDFVVDSFK